VTNTDGDYGRGKQLLTTLVSADLLQDPDSDAVHDEPEPDLDQLLLGNRRFAWSLHWDQHRHIH
jgi:hypothetical protein